jgi:hypothetical protein
LELWLSGRPISDNRLKERFTTTVDGRTLVMTRYTPAADAWMEEVEAQAQRALDLLPATTGRPTSWALPLQLDITFVHVYSEPRQTLWQMIERRTWPKGL